MFLTNIEKVLTLTLWGDWAHYRRIYTTTSSLTYPFPTRTALAGLFASILGLERDSYYDLFTDETSAIALTILQPIKTVQINFNLIRTKLGYLLRDIKTEGKRSQIPMEFVKDPKWRIFLWLEDKDTYQQLKTLLKEHKSIFTPCLGISELLANYQFEGEKKVSQTKKVAKSETVSINSIIKKSSDVSIKVEQDKKYGNVKIPAFMRKDRVVTKYLELFYEQNGKPITISRGNFNTINGEENVIFF